MHLFLAILLLSCSQFGSQIFMPALPEIAAHFDLESSTAQLIILAMISPSALAVYRSELAGSMGKIFLRSLSLPSTELMCFVNVAVSAVTGADTLLRREQQRANQG